MLKIEFTPEEIDALEYERYHHPDPKVQKKMEVLYLKSQKVEHQETFPSDPFDVDYSIINNVKDNLCPGAHDQCGVAPGLVNTGTDTFDAHLLSNSLAIDAALASAAPLDDFDGNARDATPDIGAYEYGASPGVSSIFLSLIMR